MNNVIALSLIHDKELERNFSSFILKKEVEKLKEWRRKTLKVFLKYSFRYSNQKSNPRKEPTYKIKYLLKTKLCCYFHSKQRPGFTKHRHFGCSLKKCLQFLNDVGLDFDRIK